MLAVRQACRATWAGSILAVPAAVMGLTGAQPEEVLQMGGAFGQLGGYVCGKGYMHPEA
jgi:hypothetical protein